MKSILLKILTKSPSAKSGGKILNLFGYSVLKSTVFFLFEKFRKLFKPNFSQTYNKYLIDLENKGFVVIENFMNYEDFEKLKIELDDYVKKKSKSYSESFSLPLMTMLENKINSKILKKYFYNESELYKLVCYLSGIKSNFFPNVEFNYLKSKKNLESGFNDGQHRLHYDVTYSSFKGILYLEDTNFKNGAFEYLYQSHKFSIKRLITEYFNSISNDKNKLTELTNKKSREIISVEGKKNSLIIMNAKGFHRRGLFYEDTIRSTIFVDFRYLHTLGNFLPKKFIKDDIPIE